MSLIRRFLVSHPRIVQKIEQLLTSGSSTVNCIVKDGDEYSKESLERSIACLAVSLEERKGGRRGEQLLSFKYVAAAVCLRELERMTIF